jgi:hypothetical protein
MGLSDMKRYFTGYLPVMLFAALGLRGAPLEELWEERVATVVTVEFFVEGELERQATRRRRTIFWRLFWGTMSLPVGRSCV